MATILKPQHHDHTKEFMFFGEAPTIARQDVNKFPRFLKFTEQQRGFFWIPEEVGGGNKDRQDYLNLPDHERHMFLSNIKYQSLLDSVQGRAPALVLLPLVSLPELEDWILNWSSNETMHSASYQHIIRTVVDDPSEVFDDILQIPEIMDRASMATNAYDRLFDYVYNRSICSLSEAKERLVECLMAVYALEGVRFYSSFATTFSFAKRGVLEGQGKIVSMVSRDEFLHLGATHYMLTRYLCNLDDPEMTEIVHSKIEYFKKLMYSVYEQECMWADYLFQYGGTIGMNASINKEYLGYVVDDRTNSLLKPVVNGVKHNFGDGTLTGVKNNPIPWIDKFLTSSAVQESPQEQEKSDYLAGGGLNTDSLDGDMGFLDD